MTIPLRLSVFASVLLNVGAHGQQSQGPAAVSSAGMVWDSASGEVVLYGGMRDRGEHADSTLWGWNGTRWSILGDGAPGARSGLILVSDALRNRIILYGGQNRTSQFDDTWEWRGGRWNRIAASGPGARHMTAGVFDRSRGQVVLFGGYQVERQTMLADTWVFDGAAWRRVAEGGPPARAGHAMGFDPVTGNVVVMGGADAQGTFYRDSWSWDGTRWSRLAEAPAITPNSQMVPVTGGALATFGGWDGSRPSRDLNVLNAARWETRDIPDGPSPRMETAIAFDSRRGRLVLFGGSDANGAKLADLWEFDGQAWRAVGRGSSAVFTTVGAFFALSVPNLEESVRWYSEKFGLSVIMRPPPEEKARVAVLEGHGLTVELLQLADAVPLSRAAPGVSADYLIHGYFKAGIVVEDFDATLAALRERGVEIAMGPYPARAGQRANVIVRDNAGNLIQIFGR